MPAYGARSPQALPQPKYTTHWGYYNGISSNPNIGTYNTPSRTNPNTHGNGAGPGPANAVRAPGGRDYTTWNWEQILNGVLGIALPSRDSVASGRWTTIEFNSDGEGSNLWYIMGITWNPKHQDVLIFLNPDLLNPKNAWDVFFNQPKSMLKPTFNNPPDYTQLPNVDPRTFMDAEYAVAEVTGLYANAASLFNAISAQLQGEASQYQGKGGQAFAEIIDNFQTDSNATFNQLANHPPYWMLIDGARYALLNFLGAVYNSYLNWTDQMTYSPLGAIIQVLINGDVIHVADGKYTIPGNMKVTNLGDLTTLGAWLNIEKQAQSLWKNTVVSFLDGPSQAALHSLVDAYANTTSIQPIQPVALAQITPPTPNVNSVANAYGSGIANGVGNIEGFLNNLPNYLNNAFGDVYRGQAAENNFVGNLPNYINHEVQGVANGIGNTDNYLAGLPNYINGLAKAHSQPNLQFPNIEQPATANPGVTAPTSLPQTSPGAIPNVASPSAVPQGNLGAVPQTSLGAIPNAASPSAVPQGSLGAVPQTSLGAVPQGSLGAVPQTSLGASTPLSKALATDQALNGAIGQALTSGQVPASGPLTTDLKNVAADSGNLTSALDQAAAGGSIPSAIAANDALNSALRSAIAKAPPTGPLHNALENALGDSDKLNGLLHQALAGTGQAGLVATPPLADASVVTPGQGLLGNKALLSSLQQAPLVGTAGAPAGAAAALPASSGKFVSPVAAAAGAPAAASEAKSAGAVPFYPPMAGGMGMGGMGGQNGSGERERTTWLAEDEDVWGTDPDVAPQVLGRDMSEEEDAAEVFEEFVEQLGKRAGRGASPERTPR